MAMAMGPRERELVGCKHYETFCQRFRGSCSVVCVRDGKGSTGSLPNIVGQLWESEKPNDITIYEIFFKQLI